MSVPRGRSPPRHHARQRSTEEDSSLISSRQLEAFGRTLNATASHLIGGETSQHYQSALGEIHRELRRPIMQRSVFALAKTAPRELVRSTFNSNEIQQRALAYVPDELLHNIPQNPSQYSLFQGFEASRPEDTTKRKKHGKHGSRSQKLLESGKAGESSDYADLKNKKQSMDHRLEMMGIRKNMCASEILEMDRKIANINAMRRSAVDRLAGLEQEEVDLEQELAELDGKLEEMQEELEIKAAQAELEKAQKASEAVLSKDGAEEEADKEAADAAFMSQSIYEKLPSPKSKKRRNPRRVSMPILHEHLQPGSRIREFQAHNDSITALDFDTPFGTMVSAGLDDTLRVFDLSSGHCQGMLEGHLSSVRCVQVEDNIVASGSMDATIRLWDLSQADYTPAPSSNINRGQGHDREDESTSDDLFDEPLEAAVAAPSASAMADCPLYTLSSHVAEVTALHFHNNVLVSGSADKTLRQWDMESGRCVQTLDVLWAAAQATAINPSSHSSNAAAAATDSNGWWRPTASRMSNESDFIGAIQVFQSAVACGMADSMVRLWDLRSGTVQRTLAGHTSGITTLMFDDVHLVTGSMDRSIRIWDLRTGSLVDAWAYDQGVTSMMFDERRIVAAAGEPVVKVYNKDDGVQWDCGAGAQEQEDDASALSIVEKVRIKHGYLVEGRKDGVIGVWAC